MSSLTDTAPAGIEADFDSARKVADAVLFEGYVLYPYRASSSKNQFRWQWGVVIPKPPEEIVGERWSTTTGVVLDRRPGADASVRIRLRCLQIQRRQVERVKGLPGDADGGEFEPVPSLGVDGDTWTSWEEATEQEIDLVDESVDSLLEGPYEHRFTFPAVAEVEELRSSDGELAGRVVRTRDEVIGVVSVGTALTAGPMPLVTLTIRVENHSEPAPLGALRDDLCRRAFVGAHMLLGAEGATFVSNTDPPEFAKPVVQACTNEGTWPVLVGDGSGQEVVLSSPIILEDHPEIAPESSIEFFDATEIDEMLALRVMTLTDEEKAEARATDPRAAAIIDQCDDLPPEVMERLHGAVRQLQTKPGIDRPLPSPAADPLSAVAGLAPWWSPEADASVDPWTDKLIINGTDVGAGSKVRLNPRRGGDAQDLFLVGSTATVQGGVWAVAGAPPRAVSLDDDPAADLAQAEGRYRYFHPDEIEPLDEASTDPTSPADPLAPARVLVAGIGNIFQADDGFGTEVASRLGQERMPDGVKLVDFGIRGVHLAYELLDGYETVILIDAIPGDDPPGTVKVLEVDPLSGDGSQMDSHRMDPQAVIGMVADLGGTIGRLLVVGCVPATVEEGIGLSDAVTAAVDEAVQVTRDLINEALSAGRESP